MGSDPRSDDSRPSDPIKSLLTGIIDYAGLFPPAKLDMSEAVAEYGRQLTSPQAWMLGRFVVPTSRLDELEAAAVTHLPRSPGVPPWGLSVLVAGDVSAARRRIDAFDAAHRQASQGLARVEAVEHKPQTIDDIASAATALQGLEVFFELPHDVDPTSWMQAVAAVGGCGKIRSGGVTDDAFPSSAEMARFIAAASAAGIAFKATAGLHHPMRGDYRLTYEDGSPTGMMHGFLNVFLAAAAVRAGLATTEVEALLEERSVAVFRFEADHVGWRGHRFTASVLADVRRHFARSYGSCSFAEPVNDMRALGVL